MEHVCGRSIGKYWRLGLEGSKLFKFSDTFWFYTSVYINIKCLLQIPKGRGQVRVNNMLIVKFDWLLFSPEVVFFLCWCAARTRSSRVTFCQNYIFLRENLAAKFCVPVWKKKSSFNSICTDRHLLLHLHWATGIRVLLWEHVDGEIQGENKKIIAHAAFSLLHNRLSNKAQHTAMELCVVVSFKNNIKVGKWAWDAGFAQRKYGCTNNG